MHHTNRECDVSPYADSYELIRNVPIVTGATAITSLSTGMTYILIFNEAIWMGDLLDHSLINPNQLRSHGVEVQDNPFGDIGMHIASDDDNFIHPMKADGTTIYFDSRRTPTNYELDNCPHIVLSSSSEWNPRDVQFPTPTTHRGEEGIISKVQTGSKSTTKTITFDMSTHNFDARPISCVISDRLIAEVQTQYNGDTASPPDIPIPKTFAMSKSHTGITAKELSERWLIGLAQAHETIKVTTQNCIRSAVLPLSRRYRADRVFEKPLLRGDFYTDTMDAISRGLDGRCPLERITGETVDISEYLDFGLYDWVWYRENAGLGETKIGRWLGVSHRIGTLMSFWVLTSSGKVLSRTTVQRMTQLEAQLEENKTQMKAFSDHLAERIGGNDIIAQDENGNVILEIDDWDDPAMTPNLSRNLGEQ